MKAIIKNSLLITAITFSGASIAAETESNHTEIKQGAAFTTSAVAGAALGGPVGFFLGALGGAYMGEQIKQADEAETMSESLAVAKTEIERLHQQLAFNQQRADEFQSLAMESLDLNVLFRTASDTLTEHGRLRVENLANLLQRYPQMQVRLDGHADPRGTDEYNNVLAHYRAQAVRDQLIDAGVTAERIDTYSHGSDRSQAANGDLKAYASDRKVTIDVSLPVEPSAVVMGH
ncbi:MAG: OmpA family protein [Cellvibrionaceae bacterium]